MKKILRSRLVFILALVGVIGYPAIYEAVGQAYGLESSSEQPSEIPSSDQPSSSSTPANLVEPTPEPSAEPTPEQSQEPSAEPSAKPTPTSTEPTTPDETESPQPSPTPEPTPTKPWVIGDPPLNQPAVDVRLPSGYSEENQIPVANSSGTYAQPGAYTLISDGTALGNFIFDPIASREVLEMMRSPTCSLGALCGAYVIPSDGTINPGSPVNVIP